MADLLTPATLAKWTQEDTADVVADPFAADLIDKVSQLICFIGGHDGTKQDPDSDDPADLLPEWSLDGADDTVVAPVDVQMVALQVIKRSYENPGQVLQEGSIGPLGGDRVADVQALFMDFTERERATIAKYNPDGDPDPLDGSGEIFTLSTTRGEDPDLPVRLYVPDNQQIGMTPDKNAYPSWDIPLFNPGDPGDPNNYDED